MQTRIIINNIEKNFQDNFRPRVLRGRKDAFVNSGGGLEGAPTGGMIGTGGPTPPAPKPKYDKYAARVIPKPGIESLPPVINATPTTVLPPPPPTPPPVVHPAAGTILETYCAGTNRMRAYADGRGGATTSVLETNSTSCGYTPAPPPPPDTTTTTTVVTQPAPIPDYGSSGPVSGGSIGGGGGGGSEAPMSPGGGAGMGMPEPEAPVLPESILKKEVINWPLIIGVVGCFGGVYWYLGRKQAAA